MRRSLQHRLANRFRYSKFIQLLIFSVWFRLAIVTVGVFGLIGVLVVPRIWNVAPAGWKQEVRINVIDMVQAWSLSRSARRQDRAGNYEAALLSWGAAIANYPTKPELVRGYLRTVLKAPPDSPRAQGAARQAYYLLSLTQTNQADIGLAARVYEKLRMPDVVVALLVRQTNSPDPELRLTLARSFYDAGMYASFDAYWKTNQAVFSAHPELALRYASVRDLFGPAEAATAARIQLEEAARGGDQQVLANRLLLRAASARANAGQAVSVVNTLESLKADTVSDHLALWRVLCLAGRAAEAGALIQAYKAQPGSVTEAAEFFDLAMATQQMARADEIMAWSLEHHGFTPAMCSRKAAALSRRQAWGELRQLALEIRLRTNLSPTLQGFSYLAEGQADLGENRPEQAQKAFARLGDFTYDDPRFALGMATDLVRAGQTTAAMPLLNALETPLAAVTEYWLLFNNVAVAEKNAVLLLRCSERLYQLNTNDVAAASNYAAALLLQRIEPAVTLALTSNLVSRFPNETVTVINYAAALLLNSRVDEAQRCLNRLEPSKMTPYAANEFHFISLNAAVLAKERERALELLPKIDRSKLFPPQLAWLESAERALGQQTNSP